MDKVTYTARVIKTGNSQAVVIPSWATRLQVLNINQGDIVEITIKPVKRLVDAGVAYSGYNEFLGNIAIA